MWEAFKDLLWVVFVLPCILTVAYLVLAFVFALFNNK
jgi:hypothetical protein